MTTWFIQFKGRELGAICIFSNYAVQVEGETPQEALLKVYDTHDHLSRLRLTNQTTGHSFEGFDFKPIVDDDAN